MPRRPGRPPLDDSGHSVHVNVRVCCREYDRLYAMARDQRITVPELIRRQIANGKTKKPNEQT